MDDTISIHGYRTFDALEVGGLARVNLIVGMNNSGKTSFLEAIELLYSDNPASAIRGSAFRRGEVFEHRLESTRSERGTIVEPDLAQLFHGRELSPKAKIRIEELGGKKPRWKHISMSLPESEKFSVLSELSTQYGVPLRDQGLRIEFQKPTESDGVVVGREYPWLPISVAGGLAEIRTWFPRDMAKPISFLTTDSLATADVMALLDRVILTPQEDLLLDAVRLVEPNISRIASVGSGGLIHGVYKRGGVYVSLKDRPGRIPIGNMGDGMWRILSLGLAMIDAKDSVLLIDEVDTGLHFSVLKKLWTFILEASASLNVKVFATTHSRDCVESLASALVDRGERARGFNSAIRGGARTFH